MSTTATYSAGTGSGFGDVLARLKARLGEATAKLTAIVDGVRNILEPYWKKLSALLAWIGKAGNKAGWAALIVTVSGTYLKKGTFDFTAFRSIDTGLGKWLSTALDTGLSGLTGLEGVIGPAVLKGITAVQDGMSETLLTLLPGDLEKQIGGLGWDGLTTVVEALIPVAGHTPGSALLILGAGVLHQLFNVKKEKPDNAVQVSG